LVYGIGVVSTPCFLNVVHHRKKEIQMARKPSFSQLIRSTRQQRGLSVVEVAERVGVSGQCVYLWEADKSRPTDTNLSALCKVLKLPIRATKELVAA
jgi:ribosome-binding protein aMBF1 (putative translation factor)